MKPSDAPSLIERFTSLVGHCILLNALSVNRISVAQVGQTTVAGYPGEAKLNKRLLANETRRPQWNV